MEFIYKKSKEKLPKSLYVLKVETMEGDADDYHTISFYFKEDEIELLKERVIQCEILALQYPEGKGGDEDYYHLDFFEKYFSDSWYFYEGISDSFEYYTLSYYDENSKQFEVEIVLSDDELNKIKSYEIED